MFGNKLLPPILGLNVLGMSVICVFAGTMLLLLFVDLTWPLLVGILAYVSNDIYSLQEAISNSLGHSIFWFVVLSGMVISVLNESDVIKRVSIWFLTRKMNRKNPWLFVGTLFLSSLLIGSIMDPTAFIILMTALTTDILLTLGIKKGDRFGELIMIGVLVFVGMSYGVTPIGHPVPVMMISMFEEVAQVNFFQYLLTGYFTSFIIFIAVMLLMRFVFRLDVEKIRNFDSSVLLENLKPLSKKGKLASVIYIGIIILWLLPSLFNYIWPAGYVAMSKFGTIMPLIIGVALMCVIRVEGKPMMDFNTTIKEAPWRGSFPAASAMLIGGSLSNSEAGVTEMLARVTPSLLQGAPDVVFVMIVCMFTTLLTNISANTIAAMLSGTVSVVIAASGAIPGVNYGALCIGIGMCQAFAYAMPPASTYSAIVAGQGWVRVKNQVLNAGGIGVLSSVIMSTIGYWFASLII